MREETNGNRPMAHSAREWLEGQLKASKAANRSSCVKMYERQLRQFDDSRSVAGD